MKKMLAAVATLLLVGSFAFAEATLKADDLESSDAVTENVEVNGFTITASKEKEIRVKDSKKVAPDGKSFAKRIDLRGKPSNGTRVISFSAKAGETVTVYCNSGSKTDKRNILVQTAKKKTIKSITGDIYTGEVSVGEVKIPEDGEYRVCSENGGVYIYGIFIK